MSEDGLEQRVIRDEIRLARDEAIIAQEQNWIRRNWRLELALAGLLALTIAALVIAVVALNRDIDAVAAAAPRDDSVGTSVLQDRAVSAAKLADGAVTARAVGANAMTGVQIDETSLARVPRAAAADSATRADRATAADRATNAERAGNAVALGGVGAAAYVHDVSVVRARTAASTLSVKGPLRAQCPSGTTIMAGGAAIDGATRVALTTSAPDGADAWVAEAAAIGTTTGPWRIVVTAVCTRGG